MGKMSDRDAHDRRDRQLPHGASPSDFSEALARGLRVIRAFTSDRPRMTLSEVARAVDLAPATVRRALVTLTYLGYVRLQDRNYELSPRVLDLAETYLTANTISTLVQPVCEAICDELGESCTVAVLEGEDAIMIARAIPRHLVAVGAGIGYRVPALSSSLGRVLLAALTPDELDRYLNTCRSRGATARTVTDQGALRTLIERARSDGFAYVDEEVEAAFHSVAVPLRRWDQRVIAALNVGSNVTKLPKEIMLGPVLDRLRAAAEALRPQLI
jgi:IclR family pca regulon transcriptional regulator